MPAILGARPVLRRPHSPPRRNGAIVGGKDGERATRAAELTRVKAPGPAVAPAFSHRTFFSRRRHLTAMFGAKVSDLHCEGDGSHDLLLRCGDRRA